ncbi:recombination-associated protein RdgC [Thalassotalea sp. HSM 43]|uniref:recombination-associated protein RdgC n=1 Tax=Thalassotalea sp. HSM 43 TaxID=2552945 RepID=UPI001081080F|nr:recombination-associated protein RdgC [Thalassotalea sp. HSM 43]QBY03489.1 recombination-associated protein RdgC [Thalassotalea sp. HSM 43]
MWFKNLYIFAFTRPFTTSEEELEKALQEHVFAPCAKTEMSRFGWSSALGKHGDRLLHHANGCILLNARKEEKLLPAAVVKEQLEAKVAQLEQEHSRKATKKEKEQFKEDITFELLPRAFSRISDTQGYICPDKNIIVINSSSRNKAEDFLALLRKCLGSLPVTSFAPPAGAETVMTSWLLEQNLPERFVIGFEGELKALGEDAAVIKCKNQDLLSDEILAHLNTDKQVVKIAFDYEQVLSCILCDDLSVKRVKFHESVFEQNDDIDNDDILVKIDADFTLMTGELNKFIDDMLAQFDLATNSYLES